MFNYLITSAYASSIGSTVKNTAATGADIAVDKGESGLGTLFKFIASNIDNWIAGGIIIIISWLVAKMVAGGIKKKIISQKGEDVQESVLVLVERITTIVILGVGVTIAAAINGLNFTAVIGALSLGIGFALKDIIGNFISGIIMLSQNRIKIGDFIKVKDILGTIVSIDTRATVLKAIDGTEVVIPNQSMLNETLISYSTNPFRRVDIVVGVAYNTNLPMVTTLIKGIMDKDRRIVPKPKSQVLVDAFGDSAINLIVRFWVESSASWLDIKSNLSNKIKKAFDEVGVNIPFPIRTLKLDEDDRSFLKTMDSMNKGIVPEPKLIPTKEQITQVASETENETNIPYKIFNQENTTPKVEVQNIDSVVASPPTAIEEKPKQIIPPPSHI